MTTPTSAGSETPPPASSARLRKNLAWLVCPVCHSRLETHQERDAAPRTIQCASCTRNYPVVDGIPVLLVERAQLTSATKV